MTIRRRDFLKLTGAAALAPALPRLARAADNPSVYDLERFGNARILHMTDTHAQLHAGLFSRTERQSRDRRDARDSRRIWSAAPFSIDSASSPTAPTPTPSPVSISRNPPRVSASSAALRI